MKLPNYKYYQNTKCEYYPCHKSDKTDMLVKKRRFNCLFCYCPLHGICTKGMKCEECDYPHDPRNYDTIIELLSTKEEGDDGKT